MQTNHLQAKRPAKVERLKLRIGELVEVRSEPEILATLDENGRLEELPFMPEMLQFCGRRFRVHRLAFKACDSIANTGMHRMENAVHLEGTRCDGQAHGGCQATCQLYWKEAWLKRVDPDAPASIENPPTAVCTISKLMEATRAEPDASGEGRFSCQATEMPKAAQVHISAWDVRQYVRDVTSGNARPLQVLRSLLIMVYNKYQKVSRRYLPRRLLINGGNSYRFVSGVLKGGTPKEVLNLQPGELVEIKSKEEVFQTLDRTGRNRGLRFDAEELRYCGTRARVLRRVDRIVDEKTGKLIRLPNDCVILKDVVCPGEFHQHCPRAIYPFWREVWLRRVQ